MTRTPLVVQRLGIHLQCRDTCSVLGQGTEIPHIQLSVAPWTVACQAPPTMEFPRQDYWSEFPFLLQEILPTQGLNPHLLVGRWILYHGATREAVFINKGYTGIFWALDGGVVPQNSGMRMWKTSNFWTWCSRVTQNAGLDTEFSPFTLCLNQGHFS